MNKDEFARIAWRKSSYSNGEANCVEVAFLAGGVAVRDSKEQGNGPIMEFAPRQWSRFMATVTDIGSR
ncbi:MAG TPA: DUF397 domain-containing protein [Pseudonocardiaceae bacterium]|nr:DUF397 domain-containing protein [Pseudonocardiaceae bacterium]